MKISEVLAQPTVELANGSYLASVTRSEGYVPTYKDTSALHLGQYLFKVVGEGEADLETGLFPTYKVIPVVMNDEGTAFVDDVANPIVIQEAGKVTYMTGRNHPLFKDGYNDRQFHVVEEIAAGQEHRHILLAFLEFVKSEFSMGVNDFTLEGSEYLAG